MTREIRSMLFFALLFGGCQHEEASEPPLTPAARTSPAAERAIGALAAARCDHQQRCQAIGPNGPYLNREACMNVMLSDGYAQLSGCRLGIDQDDVEECLQDIQESDCQENMVRLETIDDCSTEEICID